MTNVLIGGSVGPSSHGAIGDDVKTWVILSEAAEGGWGIDGTAYGVPEFTELARRAAQAG